MKVAYFGERGTNTELAARSYFGGAYRGMACATFAEVFAAVERGSARYGVVPIENSSTGSIHQSYDLFMHHTPHIVGEIFLGVSHHLIALPGTRRGNLRRVFSHPQALAQCERYLKRFPKLAVTPVQSTAAAVTMIKHERLLDAAAIGSTQAADENGMMVLARDIQDERNNTTRFLVLAAGAGSPAGNGRSKMKTSIVFSARNVPGALFRCLAVFALRDIDLYKIESRPMRGKHFEYIFYLDFAGNATDEAPAHALEHLKEITVLMRVLGSYPVGKRN